MSVGLFVIIISGMGMVLYIAKRVLDIVELNAKTKEKKLRRTDFYGTDIQDKDLLKERVI